MNTAIVVGTLIVLALALAFLRVRTRRSQSTQASRLYSGISVKRAWDPDERPYPCVSVWLSRNGDEDADRRILQGLKEFREREHAAGAADTPTDERPAP